jgi:hypothetical protein
MIVKEATMTNDSARKRHRHPGADPSADRVRDKPDPNKLFAIVDYLKRKVVRKPLRYSGRVVGGRSA